MFKMGEAETKRWASASNDKAANYFVQAQHDKSNDVINLQTDYSPEDWVVRYKATFEASEQP